MATFVVAHGAWSAGWAWKKMRPLMRAAGHELWTPTCTGLGERTHLAHAAIDLDTHIRDIVAVLETEDLEVLARERHVGDAREERVVDRRVALDREAERGEERARVHEHPPGAPWRTGSLRALFRRRLACVTSAGMIPISSRRWCSWFSAIGR